MKLTSKQITKKTFLIIAFLSSTYLVLAQVDDTPSSFSSASTSAPNLATSSPVLKRQIRQAVSKLRELAPEKKSPLQELPIAKTTFTAIEQLLEASLQSETLINKVESFLAVKKAAGTDTLVLDASLDQAKNTLETANISISMASSLTETWATTLSTSTYKKVVTAKKAEYRLSLDTARQNLHKTNDTLRVIMSSFITPTPPTVDPGAGIGNQTIPPIPVGTTTSALPPPTTPNIGTSSMPTPPLNAGMPPRSTSTPKNVKLLEQ